MALLKATDEIFGLRRPWSKVKDGFCDAQVREFYRFVAGLWPIDTDINSLIPQPGSNLRALYLGENEPEMMMENVFRFSLYTDEIVLVYPFANPNVIAEKYNPLLRPGEWKLQTLRLVYHLHLLTPWIDAGLVILIPDPGDFVPRLRATTWDLASERLKGWTPKPEDVEDSMISQRGRRSFLLSPRGYLNRMLKEINPNVSDKQAEDLLDFIESERRADPLLLNETLDRLPGQMMASSTGANLEMGMYICELIGAFPYTNIRFRWHEILNAREKLDVTAQLWSPLTNAFQGLKFKFLDNVDSSFACSIRQDGRLEGFRSYLRRIWNTVGGQPDASKSDALARDFRDELTQTFNEAKADWAAIDRDLLKWGIPTIGGGLASAATAIATGRLSLDILPAGFVVGGIAELVQSAMKRREFRKKVPMSVFIDLEKH